MFRNIILFYGEDLLVPHLTPKLEDHTFSAVGDSLFNIFAAIVHNWRPFLSPQTEYAPCRGDRDPFKRAEMYRNAQKTNWLIRIEEHRQVH
jgi:hypothetical protein